MGEQLSLKGLGVWLICTFFFLYEFFLRTVLGSYQHVLMKDLNISAVEFSFISSTVFLLICAFMQIPAGLITNRLGIKKSLLIATICCASSTMAFSFVEEYWLAVCLRMVMGFGAALGFIPLLVAIYEWLPVRYGAFFIGLSQFIGTMGPMLAGGPMESLMHHSGVSWRHVFFNVGLVGLLISLLVLLFVRNNTQTTGRYVITYKPVPMKKSLAKLFLRTQPWLIAILSACLYFTVEYLTENEGRTYLMMRGFSNLSAGYTLTLSWIGYAVGCPLLGFLSDYFERRVVFFRLCAVIYLSAVIMLLYVPGIYAAQAGFIFLGISAAGQTLGFALMSEQFKVPHRVVGFGLNNTFMTLMSALNAPLIGWMLQKLKVSLSDWDAYFMAFHLFVGVAFLVVLLAFLMIRETYCKSQVSMTFLSPK